MSTLKFGTDGWRAIIDEDFIPANVEKVIQAFCDWHRKESPKENHVVVGYDRRQKSEQSAYLVAEVLVGNGFEVTLSNQFCPTPCISWMVKNTDACAGIVVTASHNPFNWNGIKFKESYGGSASPEYTHAIEKQLEENEATNRPIEKDDLDVARQKKLYTTFDPTETYVTQLRSLVDIEKIYKADYKVLFDSIHGAGAGYLLEVLGKNVTEIRADANATFGGVNPEPIESNLEMLTQKMSQKGFDLGLATDGDADRIGAVDEKGRFVNSHQIFALLLKHYVEDKKLRGVIVKSISTTNMINKLCEKYELKLIETPIGFKHICKKLVEEDALMGGEESGGISFQPHVHERDGVLNGLMLLEMMSVRQKKLSELIDELYQEVGSYYFDRKDLHVKQETIENIRDKFGNQNRKSIAGKKIVRSNFVDGYKFVCEDDSWILVRASGTEPLVRVYAEGHKPEDVHQMIEEGVDWVKIYGE